MKKILPELKDAAMKFIEDNYRRSPYFDYAYTAATKLKPMKLAAYLYRLFDHSKSTWHRHEGADPDCGRGCVFCCYLKVEVNKPEALFLARHIKKNFTKPETANLKARAIVRDKLTRDQPSDWWPSQKLPCILLNEESGECRAYEARPMACRRLYSYTVDKCKSGFEGKTDDNWWWADPFRISEDINGGVAYAALERGDYVETTLEEGVMKYL